MFKRLTALLVCFTFSFGNFQYVHAQDFSVNQLPVPGTMVGASAPFAPLALKGLVVNPKKPLEFQFIVDTGKGPQDTVSIKDQANQLVKYFLAGLTIPEGDLWVNLSPYEKNRMVPAALGQTDLGRDLLAQDYILKQLTASLIYPEKDLGKAFWSRVYAKAQQQFGTTNVPVNTFNKVWILPDQAQVFENVNAAYVTKSTLKVMLDEDYLALHKQMAPPNGTDSIGSQIVRAIILPEIEKEVNTGKNFAPLRQIYQALILAKWYKETIQNGLLDAVYTNKNKIAGVNLTDPAVKEQIYERYLKAYKKGAFNYIKEDPTPDGQVVPRKYFSGGTSMAMIVDTHGNEQDVENQIPNETLAVLTEDLEVPGLPKDAAMTSESIGRSVNGVRGTNYYDGSGKEIGHSENGVRGTDYYDGSGKEIGHSENGVRGTDYYDGSGKEIGHSENGVRGTDYYDGSGKEIGHSENGVRGTDYYDGSRKKIGHSLNGIRGTDYFIDIPFSELNGEKRLLIKIGMNMILGNQAMSTPTAPKQILKQGEQDAAMILDNRIIVPFTVGTDDFKIRYRLDIVDYGDGWQALRLNHALDNLRNYRKNIKVKSYSYQTAIEVPFRLNQDSQKNFEWIYQEFKNREILLANELSNILSKEHDGGEVEEYLSVVLNQLGIESKLQSAENSETITRWSRVERLPLKQFEVDELKKRGIKRIYNLLYQVDKESSSKFFLKAARFRAIHDTLHKNGIYFSWESPAIRNANVTGVSPLSALNFLSYNSKLEAVGVTTIGQLTGMNFSELGKAIGRYGAGQVRRVLMANSLNLRSDAAMTVSPLGRILRNFMLVAGAVGVLALSGCSSYTPAPIPKDTKLTAPQVLELKRLAWKGKLNELKSNLGGQVGSSADHEAKSYYTAMIDNQQDVPSDILSDAENAYWKHKVEELKDSLGGQVGSIADREAKNIYDEMMKKQTEVPADILLEAKESYWRHKLEEIKSREYGTVGSENDSDSKNLYEYMIKNQSEIPADILLETRNSYWGHKLKEIKDGKDARVGSIYDSDSRDIYDEMIRKRAEVPTEILSEAKEAYWGHKLEEIIIGASVADAKKIYEDMIKRRAEVPADIFNQAKNAIEKISHAMITNNPFGGIDLNQINVSHNGKTVNVQFDPAQLSALEQGGFEGFTPVITGFQYIKSPFTIMGINIVDQPERLVKV